MGLDDLQPGLRAAWAHSQAVRADLRALLSRVPVSRWSEEPAPGRWSVAQQVDHLLRAEIGTSKLVRRLIRGDFRELVRPEGARLHGSSLASYPFGEGAAPAALEPGELTAAEAPARLGAARERFLAELRLFAGPDPDALASPDSASEFWFTLAGWVRVQALHEAHHLVQIRRIVRDLEPGNPPDEKRALLRHFLAALAYRTQKALRGAGPEFGAFRAAEGLRTPAELVCHMTSVLGYARTYFIGGSYRPDALPSLQDEVARFHEMLADLGQHLEAGTPLLQDLTPERLLQGPFSDAMTHAGQLAMLRRLAGAPVAPENFIVAEVDPARLGAQQAQPASPDERWPEAPPGWVPPPRR